ncbi:MAG: right-handed parallel beta-helix repeat-containing protein [Phycisphaerales bacterium]
MGKVTKFGCVRLAVTIAALLAGEAGARVIYVDAAGRCGGTSWQNAFTNPQAAIDAATPGDEIRIAQGVYTPPSTWDRTFRISKTIAIRGGYAGLAEPNPDSRDIAHRETILSGDLNGDDGPGFANTSDNSPCVVSISGHAEPTLDGVTIASGYARADMYSGGGIRVDEAGLTLVCCTIRGNRSNQGGGVYYRANTRIKMVHCRFMENTAVESGGAIDGERGELVLSHCTFLSNRVTGTALYNSRIGGAIVHDSGRLCVVACRFYDNVAKTGGAIYGCRDTLTLRDCIFAGNQAEQSGGAIAVDFGECQIDGCSFVANTAQTAGGAVSFDAHGTLSSSILWGNQAPSGPQILLKNRSSSTSSAYIPSLSVSHCDIEQGAAAIAITAGSDLLWAEGNLDADPVFVRYPGPTDGDWGDLRLSPDSPCRDAGDPETDPSARVDVDGEPRVLLDRMDIGSDEYAPAPIEPTTIEIAGPDQVQEDGQGRFCLRGVYPEGRTVDLSEMAAWSARPLDYGHMDPNGLLRLNGCDTATSLQVNAVYATDRNRLEATRTIAYAPIHLTYHVDARQGVIGQDGLSRRTALPTIQQAVDLAEDGDTIWVYPGVYEGPVDFLGKAIAIQGRDGAATIDGKGYFGVVFESGEGPASRLQNVVIVNCSVGVFATGGSPTIQYVTAADNHVGIGAYGDSNPTIRHSIFWRNAKADLIQCEAAYSCVEHGDDRPWNLHTDPLFADAARGDYHLKSEAGRWDPGESAWVQDDVTSPCIDAGYLPEPWDQELWPNGKRVNIGAYGNTREASMSTRAVGHPADLNHNGIVDGPDLALFANRWREQAPLLAEDLDRNGDVDAADLETLASSWLMPEASETVAFRDYWPYAIGNCW